MSRGDLRAEAAPSGWPGAGFSSRIGGRFLSPAVLPMRLSLFLAALVSGAGAVLPAAPVVAQERLAYVLVTTGTPGGDLTTPRADGMAVSRGLIGAGVSTIRRENADPANFAFGAVAPLTLLYFSGPTMAQGGETWLLAPGASETSGGRPEGWPLLATIKALKARGALQVVAVVQGCHRPGPGFAAPPPPPVAAPPTAAAPPAPAPVDPLDETLILYSADPAQGCTGPAPDGTRLTDRFLAALASGAPDLAAALAETPGEGWADMRLHHRVPSPMASAGGGAGSGAPDPATLLRTLPPEQAAELAAMWKKVGAGPGNAPPPGGTLVLTPAAPIEAGQRADTAPPSQDAASAGARPVAAPASGSGLRLVEVSSQMLLAARPTAAGLPRPSVIVGEIRPTPAAFTPGAEASATAAPEAAPAASFYGMSASARAAMRAENAAAFVSLVDGGAFDPPPEQIAAAIQTELQRLSCYGAGIDGNWGSGSRSAVDRYYTARKDAAPSREPTLVLYRDILAAEDLTCPAQRQTAPAAAPARTTATRAPAATTTTTRRATAPAATAPKKPTTGTIDAGALGRGVMR